ncbi:MAG: DUF58 domain-containing protein [Defluviitaleaceae bacterium]|nr:DUF58 domain-containing protein [Defluviitaleaceae bacterium]
MLWIFIALSAATGAYFTGERILFFSAAALIILPAASCAATFLLLRGVKISRKQPSAVVKNEDAAVAAVLHNHTPMPFSEVRILLNADENAVVVQKNRIVSLGAFKKCAVKIPFSVEYRGFYALGLHSICVTDPTGLFHLSRKIGGAQEIVSLPTVAELTNVSVASNLMTQTSSRFDIRDEDYSTVSDIRQYLPSDSIKRVHWKLTAKRNEWLVKIFQSNALNIVSVILDTTRLKLSPPETYAIEDALVENALGIAKFCLNRGMPVDFHAASKTSAKSPAEFAAIYHAAAALRFTGDTDAHTILSAELNAAAGYLNAVIVTSRLTAPLCERVLNAGSNGHFVFVMYFPPETPCDDSEEIFKILSEAGRAAKG